MDGLDALREELLSLAGVAGAQVDAPDESSPSGVRVQLEPGADARAVGVEVQRVLASHGYRTRVAEEEARAAEDPLPPAAEAVSSAPWSEAAKVEDVKVEGVDVDEVGVDDESLGAAAEAVSSAPWSEAAEVEDVEVEDVEVEDVETEDIQVDDESPAAAVEAVSSAPWSETAEVEDEPVEDERPSSVTSRSPRPGGLESVMMEESSTSVTVTVKDSEGRTATETAEPSEEGIGHAVVAAVGMLIDGHPARILWMRNEDVLGDQVVSLIAERNDGSRGAGAAIIRVGIAHAVGRAAWGALS